MRTGWYGEPLRLFQTAGDPFYDDTPLPRLDLEALDMGAVRHYLRETDQFDTRSGSSTPTTVRSSATPKMITPRRCGEAD